MTPRYAAFVSYSHADRKAARWLHRQLETFTLPGRLASEQNLPRRPFVSVFRDEEELGASPDLGQGIRDALASSACLVVIGSRAAAASQWVETEIRYFQSTGNHRVFVLIAEDVPPAQALPAVLRQGPREPLAASLHGPDGSKGALLRLAAGMLGLSYDDLRRRDARRRTRRLATVTAASVIGMIGAGVLATLAVIGRNEAQTQRAIAEREAQTTQRVSDFMMELFSQVDPDQARGREVTVREVFERGAELIDHEVALDAEIRRRLLQMFGNVYVSLGHYDAAIPKLETAVSTARAAGDRPVLLSALNDLSLAYERADRLADAAAAAEEALQLAQDDEELAAAYYRRGLVRVHSGALDEAEADLELALTRGISALGGEDEGVAAIYVALANLFHEREDNAAVRDYLARALAVRRTALGPDHPDTISVQCNFAQALSQTGDTDAGTEFESCLARQTRVLGEMHPTVARTLNNMAIAVYPSDPARARDLFERARDIRLATLGTDHADVAESYNNLGYVDYIAGRLESARAQFEAAREIWAERLGADHPQVGEALTNLADVTLALGRTAEARALIEQALKIREARLPGTTELAHSPTILGRVEAAAGAPMAAEAAYARAEQIFREKAVAGYEVAGLLAEIDALRAALTETVE